MPSHSSEPIRCLCLTGPTASGKTELALAIAAELPVDIVSMDSALVYRGMDIGTAKPSPELRLRVPHFLIDILDPLEAYSAGRFVADARAVAESSAARGRIPLFVGGTLLYWRALTRGLAELPSADPELRRELDAEADRLGWPALHARLARLDAAAAAKIAPTDRQRIQRALEVCILSGAAMSSLQRQASATLPPLDLHGLAIVAADRTALAARIEGRFDAMVAAGFVAEVEALRARGDLSPELPSMRAVGYRQLWGFLAGEFDWPEARRRALAATRQLAKRQLTWLRSEPNLRTLEWSKSGCTDRVLQWAISECLQG
jgi:tRNA dimethylallyltransferase